MAGLNLTPLAASSMGANMAKVPADMAGLQLQQSNAELGQSQAQLGQYQVATAQRQQAEMQGLQKAAQEATNPNTGQLDQDRFIGLVGQYAPSHLPAIMQAGGMYGYRQAMGLQAAAHGALYRDQSNKVQAQTQGLDLANVKNADDLVSRIAQGAVNLKTPDGQPDMLARQAFIQQNMPILQRAGIKPEDISGINLDDESLGAYVNRGLSGHDYAQVYKMAHDAVGKVGQDEQNGFVSPQWADKERERITNIKEGTSFGTNGAMHFTPAALDSLVEQYHIYGPEGLRPFGNRFMSGPAFAQIANREAEIYKETARNWQGNQADLKATMASQVQTQKTRDAVIAFERNAVQNGKVALDLLEQVADAGSPMANKPIREILSNFAGDPRIKGLQAQLNVYAKEVGRITTNPNLTGQLTVSERDEMEKLNNPMTLTANQFREIYNLLNGDMSRRHQSLDALLVEQKARIPRIIPTASEPGSSAPPANLSPAAQAFLKKHGNQATTP